ncbi:MAG: hypothetical protein WDA17_04535 [Sphaerochaetaceae bacterium]
MLHQLLRLLKLFLGLFLYALGIVLTMKANVGYAPWEVFHAGIANVLNLQIGTVVIIFGLLFGLIAFIFGEKIGLGTLFNIIFIGMFMNGLLNSSLFVESKNLISAYAQLIVGLFVISFATFFYISSGFGAGPRDSIMVLIARKTNIGVGYCRIAIEVAATLIGALLGGMLGWGTLVSALLIGFCIQITFKILRFDPRLVEHEDLLASLSSIIKVFGN